MDWFALLIIIVKIIHRIFERSFVRSANDRSHFLTFDGPGWIPTASSVSKHSFPTNYKTSRLKCRRGRNHNGKYWERNDTATARFILSYLQLAAKPIVIVPPLIKSVKNRVWKLDRFRWGRSVAAGSRELAAYRNFSLKRRKLEEIEEGERDERWFLISQFQRFINEEDISIISLDDVQTRTAIYIWTRGRSVGDKWKKVMPVISDKWNKFYGQARR